MPSSACKNVEKKQWPDPRYFAAAPTREQAKRIFWKDLKALIPKRWIKRVSESELSITTKFGSELFIVGLDKPERIEGVAWDGAVMDEYANMRANAWQENVRPALSDRQGWCWFVGVPEGLNHYKDLADYAKKALDPDWGFYSWPSSDILPKDEVEAARRILDEKTFRQEYEASFEGSSGRVFDIRRRRRFREDDRGKKRLRASLGDGLQEAENKEGESGRQGQGERGKRGLEKHGRRDKAQPPSEVQAS